MPSSSMEPTITAGSNVKVDLNAFRNSDPSRWDVVTFSPPKAATSSKENQTWIMRIVGLPGETVDFSGSNIQVDGTQLTLPIDLKELHYLGVEALKGSNRITRTRIVLGAGEYFVLGDNSSNANDSRYWGALSRGRISGKLVAP